VLRRGLCLFLCVFLCGALAVSLTPFSDRQEDGQHDRASDDSEPPSTWLGRWNQRGDKRAVDSDFVWIPPEQLAPLAAKIVWIPDPPVRGSMVAHTSESWRATPVRGPPYASARVLLG
jgi:hypothetical protein